MKNRDYFLPSITTLTLFGLVWFLSCAHQNRYRESGQDDFAQLSEAPQEDGFAEAPKKSDFEDFSNNSDAEEGNDGFAQAEQRDEESSLDSEAPADEFAFATEKPSQSQQEESTQTDNSGFADESAFTETNDVENEKSQEQALAPIPESGEEQSANASDVFSPEMAESVIQEPEPQSKPTWVARSPKVPKSSFMKKGTRLNRFYFVRKGDSSKKLSKLFYGDTSHSKKLRSWNGAGWLPGNMVFYSSPQDPSDTRMISYYQENQVAAEEYKARKGDSLSSIARKKLGHTRSWKEIAVVNGIVSPNALEAGQVLALYPRDFSLQGNPVVARVDKPAEPAFAPPEQQMPELQELEPEQPGQAQAPAQPEEALALQQPEIQPPVAEAPRQELAPQPQFQEPEAPFREQAEVGPVSSVSELNWDQLVEQNFVAILIGAALIILLLALSARKKRKKNAAAQEGDSESEPKSRFGRR